VVLGVRLVGELRRQEDARVGGGELLRHPHAPDKASLLVAHRHHPGAKAGNQVTPLVTHPVGHEDRHRVTERPTDGSKRDPAVPAAGLRDRVPGRESPGAVGLLEDVQRHPVLDAAGEVQGFELRKDRSRCAAPLVMDREQRRVPDQPLKTVGA
jgi:hypothetical protein